MSRATQWVASHGRLYVVYSSVPDRGGEQALERVSWVLYVCSGPEVRNVLVGPSQAVWDCGPDIVGDGVVQLIKRFGSEVGNPPSALPQDAADRAALWFLLTPQATVQGIHYLPALQVVHLWPVVAINPACAAGSLQALQYLFPVLAEQGIKVIRLQLDGEEDRVWRPPGRRR